MFGVTYAFQKTETYSRKVSITWLKRVGGQKIEVQIEYQLTPKKVTNENQNIEKKSKFGYNQ